LSYWCYTGPASDLRRTFPSLCTLSSGVTQDHRRICSHLAFASLASQLNVILTGSEPANMLAPPKDLSELPTDQCPTDYTYARPAACLLFIVLSWLLVRRWIVSRSNRRFEGRSSLVELKSQNPCTTTSVDHCSLKLDLNIYPSKPRNPILSWKLLGIMALSALLGILLLGYFPLACSLHDGLRSLVRSSLTPSSTALQDVFQVYQPVPFNSSGDTGCDVEILLMDHVFGASYGAPFVGKRVENYWS